MFDTFTDRSRKVLNLAKVEADGSGADAVYVDHLLIALIREGSGVAHHVLSNFDISIKRIRDEAEIIRPAPNLEETHVNRISDGVIKTLENSLEEAKKLRHNYVGTEHLLLGVLYDESNIAVDILKKCNIDPQEVREYTLNLLGFGTEIYSLMPVEHIEGEGLHSVGRYYIHMQKDAENSPSKTIGIYNRLDDTIQLNGFLELHQIPYIIRAIRDHQYE